jgi:hypothetical protein
MGWGRSEGLAVAVAVAVVALLAACGGHRANTSGSASSLPTSYTTSTTDGQQAYLAPDMATVVLVRWTVSKGILTGTLDLSQLTSDVSGRQLAITGTLRGDNVSFDVSGTTWTGTLDATALVMHIPQPDGSLQTVRFEPGDIEAYNAAVAALHGQGEANAQATADARNAANAAQAVATADQRLGSDLDILASSRQGIASDAVLTGDIGAATTDLATARADYKIVQQSVSAHDCGTAGGDAATVGSDAATVDSDAATIDSDLATIESDVTGIQQTLSAVNTDFAALKQASLASPSSHVQHTQTQVYAEIDKTDKAIRGARAAGAAAKKLVASVASQAHQVADQAQALADGCTN